MSLIANPALRRYFGVIDLSTFFSFSGRLGRPTFWLVVGLTQLAAALVIQLADFFSDVPALTGATDPADLLTAEAIRVFAITSVASIIVSFWAWPAALAKRYHDSDSTGWFSIVNVCAWIVLGVIGGVVYQYAGTMTDDFYILTMLFGASALITMLAQGIASLVPGLTRGMAEENRHGPPPPERPARPDHTQFSPPPYAPPR